MPAYNEEANIRQVISQWYPIVEKIGGTSRLVVLNDGSKDRTGQVLRRCMEEYPRLVGINKENEGHGATILRGYQYAIQQGADYIFQTDSDGQTIPGEFWRLWKNREQGGLHIGHRKKRQDGISRIFVTRVLRLALFVTFGVWVKDANTPFRLMEARELAQVIQDIPERFNLSNVLMTVIYKKRQLGVHYYPITFRPRQGGKNSINMKKIVPIGRQAFADFRRLRKSL